MRANADSQFEELNMFAARRFVAVNSSSVSNSNRTAKLRKSVSGGGSVGRVVASHTRDLRFESQHWQSFIYQL